jgi:hypothetical protein
MKSENKDMTVYSCRIGRSFVSAIACSMALLSLTALPAVAQREESNVSRSAANSKQSEVRSSGHQNGGNETRGNNAQGQNNVSRSNAPQQQTNTPRSNSPQQQTNAPRSNSSQQVGNAPRSNNMHQKNVSRGGIQRQDNRSAQYNHYYGQWPSRGARVRTLPQNGHWEVYNGSRYMYHNGFYYRPYGSSYVVVAPPIGFHINALPVGFVAFTLANAAYYYYAGTYYQHLNNQYVVVQPPLGSLVQTIPEGGKQVVIDGNTFYIVDGIQYQAVMYNGSIWYKVIKIENQANNYSVDNY